MHKIEQSQICTKPSLHEGTKLQKGTKLHKDDFARRVNFARVTFLHDNEKIQKKKKHKKKFQEKLIK